MDTHAAVLRGADGGKLTLEMDGEPFAFSAVPYTPRQLEQAAHVEELNGLLAHSVLLSEKDGESEQQHLFQMAPSVMTTCDLFK